MKDRLQQLYCMRDNWVQDRPVVAKNNGSRVRTLYHLRDEVKEAIDAFEGGHGDQEVRRELADVGWFALDAMRLFEGDLFEEMREKMALNIIRYQAWLFQEGDYHEQRKIVKNPQYEMPKIQEFYANNQ